MISLTQAAATVVAITSIGGGALALDRMHVAAEDFKDYIEVQQKSSERDYILKLKKDIRDIRTALSTNPDETYLIEALADAVDDLCELRPEDRLCEDQ